MHQPMAYRQSTMSPEEIAAALLDPTVDDRSEGRGSLRTKHANEEDVPRAPHPRFLVGRRDGSTLQHLPTR